MKYFNIAGPCNKTDHYMIDASERIHGVEELIGYKQYFVIHAARQSGKTTYLKDLSNRLNADGKYYCLYCSLESLQDVIDPQTGIPEIVRQIQSKLARTDFPHKEEFAINANYQSFTTVLFDELSKYVKILDKPLVILFDEADCLSEGTMIAFLRQLRDGHNSRAMSPFVDSVALVGMRNIRDYKVHLRPDSESLGTASPFNIITKAFTINSFTKAQIEE
ncbi:MAG: ATP-binding protein, partial [Bacteroidales bacterium]|nr:ATP-binding protein [Bacteroidales bacterium]